MGDTVMYLNVTESNTEPTLLFSAPSVVGDTLEIDPVNFVSEVDPGPGADLTDSGISTTVLASPGFFIDNIMVSELGDFTLVGIPGANAEASVGAAFYFEVLEVDGTAVANGPTGNVNMQFTSGSGPNGGVFSLPGDTGTSVVWEGHAFLDIAAAMDASPFAGQRATAVELKFDNSLATFADANASAFIKKKIFGGLQIQTNIPEPGSFVLAILACSPLVLVALRRR